MWTNKEHRTVADDADDFGHGPSGGPLKMWLAGMGVAGPIVAYGIACVISGEATLLSRQNSNLHVTGEAATMLGIAYTALGLFIHFHYFWGLHRRLWRYSQALKVASLIVFLPCFLYGIFLALNLASWLQ
jgi:hypothetical protein